MPLAPWGGIGSAAPPQPRTRAQGVSVTCALADLWLPRPRGGGEDRRRGSSSKGNKGNKETRKQKQPPHIQARKCYERYLKIVGGCKFLVTMEESSPSNPNPIEFEVGENGIILVTVAVTSANVITSQRAPRVG